MGNEVRAAPCQRLAVVKRAGKHTSCSCLPGPKATVTLGEEESGAEGGRRAKEKEGEETEKEPEGFAKWNGGKTASALSSWSTYVQAG